MGEQRRIFLIKSNRKKKKKKKKDNYSKTQQALSKSDQKPFIVKAEANLAMKRKVKSKMQSRSRKRNTWTSYVKENFTTAYKDAREVIPDRIAAFSSASSVVAAKFREEKENNQKSNINTKRKKRKIRIDPTPRLKK